MDPVCAAVFPWHFFHSWAITGAWSNMKQWGWSREKPFPEHPLGLLCEVPMRVSSPELPRWLLDCCCRGFVCFGAVHIMSTFQDMGARAGEERALERSQAMSGCDIWLSVLHYNAVKACFLESVTDILAENQEGNWVLGSKCFAILNCYSTGLSALSKYNSKNIANIQ